MIKIHDGTPWHNQIIQGIKLFSNFALIVCSSFGAMVLLALFMIFITGNIVATFAFSWIIATNWMYVFLNMRKEK